ncbi:MAG: hypothetical protein ACUVRV_05390 [Cyanobacteriota bacterium]
MAADPRDPSAITVFQLLDEPPGRIPLNLEVVTLTWHDWQRSRQRLVSPRGIKLQLMLPCPIYWLTVTKSHSKVEWTWRRCEQSTKDT